MSTPILSPDGLLDSILLTSATYPAGFSHALYSQWRGQVRTISTEYLAFMVLPFLAVSIVTGSLRSHLLPVQGWLRGTDPLWLFGALLLVPVALLVEYLIGAISLFYASGGRGPLLRSISLPTFWNRSLTPLDYLLLGIVVVGEEIFYRGLWLGVLHTDFGLPIILALAISSLAYGINHLNFGPAAVGTKAITGALYGGLYLLGNGNLMLPILAHGLQNLTLLLASHWQATRQTSASIATAPPQERKRP